MKGSAAISAGRLQISCTLATKSGVQTSRRPRSCANMCTDRGGLVAGLFILLGTTDTELIGVELSWGEFSSELAHLHFQFNSKRGHQELQKHS